MPEGKGTYGNQVGRPPKKDKNKKPIKGMGHGGKVKKPIKSMRDGGLTAAQKKLPKNLQQKIMSGKKKT